MTYENVFPIESNLWLYEGSFVKDPHLCIKSNTPLPSLAVGEYVDHYPQEINWNSIPNDNEEFRIKKIRHLFCVQESRSIHKYHKMVLLEIVPKEP